MSKKIIQKVFIDTDSTANILENIKNNQILDISEILPIITPGTDIRNGLDEILYGKLGGLIVLGSNSKLEEIQKGGINFDLDFTSQKVFELSKMDGAIILSSNLKKIIGANKHLMPDRNIESNESGMRHRSAEQTSIATGLPVVAISHRRSIISLYFREQKYVLQDLGQLLIKGNYSLNNLREYRNVVDKDLLDFIKDEYNTLDNSFLKAISLIQKILFLYKHKTELDKIIVELGREGYDILQTVYELVYDLELILISILRDFSLEELSLEQSFEKIDFLKKLDFKTIYDEEQLIKVCGVAKIVPRGFLIIQRIQNIDRNLVERIIFNFKDLKKIKSANIGQLCLIEGIDSVFAKYIKSELERLNEDLFCV